LGPRRLPVHQKLALAVIAQAFSDAVDRNASPAVQSEARRFVSGSPMLDEWCAVANIDPAFMRDIVARFLRGQFAVVAPRHVETPRQRRPQMSRGLRVSRDRASNVGGRG
jgi:hypothetical protein